MKIFIIIFIFSFFCLNVTCQKTRISGVVSYSFKTNKFNEKRDNLFDELNKQSRDIKFILSFNGTKSIFKVEDRMESDINNIGKSYAQTIVGKGSFYSDLSLDLTIRKSEFYGESFLISSKPSLINWELSSDSKMIGKYKCFKATVNKIVKNQTGQFYFKIIAWYTPEIPASFGPKEYNNLPGLILELKDTHYTFFVNKIKLSQKNEIKIKIPTKGKKVTQAAFEKIGEESRFNFIKMKN